MPFWVHSLPLPQLRYDRYYSSFFIPLVLCFVFLLGDIIFSRSYFATAVRQWLQEHKRRMVEAKRRDHRVLGKKLDLFSLQEDAGGGLVREENRISV